jgi:hypothetical protein
MTMRLSDLEKVQHWSDELAKLRAALARLKDGPVKVELRFCRTNDLPEQAPVALIDIGDPEFAHIEALVRYRVLIDMSEVVDALTELGASPDPEWSPKRNV